ncbi:NAD(P)+ transhydrogenase beta chain [Martelella radicis]|uniref:NAD(P)+ transhydrogenase beta chain n=1 Tax=Martelella radicis TaxID=1397476 RepID=A0A7W6PA30_9HYPH|nr:NAD(P)+ transhydrogenase beta chain [Martelella radicis]MBB4122932.1 hypothetical protein [Martelella radicis]
MIRKPQYKSSKLYIGASLGCAWLVIFVIVVAAVQTPNGTMTLITTVIPTMVGVILALLGIHRGFGSLDMRTIAKSPPDRPGGS